MVANARNITSSWITALVFAAILADHVCAGSPDGLYRFGDDMSENASPGGTPGADFGPYTVDSQFLDNIAFSDASDLSYSGGPTYFDAGSGPLARPGAAAGTYGLKFNGSSDLLFRTGGVLGVPAQGDNVYAQANGAPGYTNITTRYIEAWVRPAGGAGTRRDIVNDSARFSLFINRSNNWAVLNGTTTVNSGTPAALNTWTHVMHRTFDTAGAALYVNGIAVAATTAGYATDDQAGQALDLVIGAGLNRSSSFFIGQLDEVVIGVAGNNTGQPGGRIYGDFALATDNDYVRKNLLGVNPGDINRDGSVNATDANTLIENWRRLQQVSGVTVGDLNTRAFGDLNMNGVVDREDALTLDLALRAAGVGSGLDFSLLVPDADFEFDGDVDGVDLATWKTGFGATSSASHMQGDADGDGDVDGTDFVIWQRQLGTATTAAATTAVPEPATLRLMIAGVLAMVCRRRKVCHKLMRV